MFSFTIGQTTVDFSLLIIIFGIALLTGIIISIRIRILARQLRGYFQKKQYEKAIAATNKLLKYCQRSRRFTISNKIKNKAKKAMENYHIYLAVSYLHLSDDYHFMHYVCLLDNSVPVKHILLALYFLEKEKYDPAQFHCDFLAENPNFQNVTKYLDGVRLYKQGEEEEAKKILADVYPKLSDDLKMIV